MRVSASIKGLFAKPCAYPGCNQLTYGSSGYCDTHLTQLKNERVKNYDSKRQSSSKRGYNSKWREARLAYLTEHPLCVECEKRGIVTPATDVDHIIPHRGDKQLFWDRDNWQALCHECHSRKTATEDGAFGNEVKNERQTKKTNCSKETAGNA